MEVIVIKTLLGTIMGKTDMKIPLDERLAIADPVDIHLITVPVQSKIGGQPGITMITNMVPLPTRYLNIVLSKPYHFFFLNAKDTALLSQYFDTLKKNEASIKKLDS